MHRDDLLTSQAPSPRGAPAIVTDGAAFESSLRADLGLEGHGAMLRAVGEPGPVTATLDAAAGHADGMTQP